VVTTTRHLLAVIEGGVMVVMIILIIDMVMTNTSTPTWVLAILSITTVGPR
jgi:hypothetical protein